MKYMLNIYLVALSFIFCAIPNWNFNEIAIELNTLEFNICAKNLYGITATTKRKITKTGDSVTYKNYVKVNSG